MENKIVLNCPNCGQQMKLHNPQKRLYLCLHCNCQLTFGNTASNSHFVTHTNGSTRTIPAGPNASLWQKYNKLLSLQDYSSAAKLLDSILEEFPDNIKAVKEKIRISDYYFDKGEVLSQFIAGKSIDEVGLNYTTNLFNKEYRRLCILTNEAEALKTLKESLLWDKIEAIYNHFLKNQSASFNWNSLSTGYFYQFINSQERDSIDAWSKSERRKFSDYMKKCYQDHYHLDNIISFIILSDKKTVIFESESSDGDYTSFLRFQISGNTLIAPKSISHGDFEFKPSLFNKRYEFSRIGERKPLMQPCSISLTNYQNGDVYALKFGNHDTVYFKKTERRFEEIYNGIKYGWGINGIPLTVHFNAL